MTRTKRKYIESHWLIYAFQGVVSLLFGWYIMFTGNQNASNLVASVGVVLLALGIIEVFNLLHRKRNNHNLALSLILAVTELIIAFALLFTLNQNPAWALTIIAVYTLGRGVLELLLAFRSLTDPTDRFMWAVCGICGCVIAFVVFNSGHIDPTTFIKFFGTYMMIYGVTNLIYGVHNKNELAEDKAERAARRAAAISAKKKTKKSKK